MKQLQTIFSNLFLALMNVADFFSQTFRLFNRVMPKGLYARSLIIVMMPTFVLLSVASYIFLERHWQLVTEHLARATARDVAFIVEVYEQDKDKAVVWTIQAQEKLGLEVHFMPSMPLPPKGIRPFFDPLDRNLHNQLAQNLKQPFWLDTVGQSNFVEIRVTLSDATMKVIARRGHSYASSSFIFIAWLLATSLVVLTIALLFLRNQIRPIVRLAKAAQEFGKGREAVNFTPSGAREVRAASLAFIEMKKRIERQIDQRTIMLAGVSHDLRTILTRFKLEIAFLPENETRKALNQDVNEMNKMVEAYLAFAKGEEGEKPILTNMLDLLLEVKADKERIGHNIGVNFQGETMIIVRPLAFKRAITNLVGNAVKYASVIEINGTRDDKYLRLFVDDNGTGIAEELREEVFKPFFRVDKARNLNETGTGLGLAITRDIIRSSGGEVTIEESRLGGVRAVVRVPL